MRVLGLETSSRVGSVALLDDGVLIARREHAATGNLAENIVQLLAGALEQASWRASQLERVAVGVGPGSFTGLRVGLSVGHGLALGLGVPIVGVPSLAALAAAVPVDRHGLRVAVLDARRDEVFVAIYGEDGREHRSAEAVGLARFADWLATNVSEPWVFVGEGAPLVGGPPAQGPGQSLPDAESVARLGQIANLTAAPVEPVYVRDAGATPQSLPPPPSPGMR